MTLPTIQTLDGPIPLHLVDKIGNLSPEDWEGVLDEEEVVYITRGRLLALQRHLEVALRMIGWVLLKSGQSAVYFTPEADDELRDVYILLDHTKDKDPIWRFRLLSAGEEVEDATNNATRCTKDGGGGKGE